MSQKQPEKQKRAWIGVLLSILFGAIFLFSSALTVLGVWYMDTFEMDFEELLYTVLSPVGGTGQSTVADILSACLVPVLLLGLGYFGVSVLLWGGGRARHVLRVIGAVLCIVGLLASCVFAMFAFRIPEYLEASRGTSELYERYYVDPDTVKITDLDGKPKNLIYIYLESMETTYASKEVGGEQPEINYIPRLTALAEENISFSDGEGLGGFHSIAGTSWTMGALMGTTSGVPFSLAVFGGSSHNSLGKDGNFVNGLTALGDILETMGYRQEFLCGSDIRFAGRDTYFTQHGNYEIFDYYSAYNAGYVDDFVFWGLPDHVLYDIARAELTKLSSEDGPFNFTMLTVDTHHVGGYVCEVCGSEYETGLENVVSCADAQLGEFIDWCREQDFYEDTVIIVTGDHPRMDSQLVKNSDILDRTIYNCYINSESDPKETRNRVFTSLDLFPTTLAAMGYAIEGERLGLGTNLFSAMPTLAERQGYAWLEDQVSKRSDYYVEHFVNEN